MIAQYWPVLLVILTALGTYAVCHGSIVWYRWRFDEAADTVRKLMAENSRLRRVLTAYEGTRDE